MVMAAVNIGSLIECTPDIAGGSACIAGTRIPVKHIAEWHNDGLSPDEMVALLPALDLTRVYAAMTYYLANKAAVDEEIAQGDAMIGSALADPDGRARTFVLPR
jgi:uncharacterized protein (DUF433 family)